MAAKKNVTTVTHPDGTVSKRTSARAIYTHAVVVGPKDPAKAVAFAEAQAAEYDRKAEVIETAVAAGQTKIINRGLRRGADPDQDFEGKPSYHGFEIYLLSGKGSVESQRCNSKGITETLGSYDENDQYVSNPRTEVRTRADGTTYTTTSVILRDAREVLLEDAARRARGYRKTAQAYREEAAAYGTGGEVVLADAFNRGKTRSDYSVVRWSSREDLATKALTEFDYLARQGHSITVVPVD